MTLTEGIAAIRDRFQDHMADGIAFSRYDPTADVSRSTRIYRITDVRVASNEVLLVIDPGSTDRAADLTHMTAGELLGRLTALPAACAEYALEACEPEIHVEEEDTRIRFDYPIMTTGRADELRLCLLACIEQKSDDRRTPWWKFWQRA